jgi:hypothetical protein
MLENGVGLWPGSMDLGLFVGAPSTVFAQSRDQLGTQARLTGTWRIAQDAHVRQPCGSRTGRPHERRPGGP